MVRISSFLSLALLFVTGLTACPQQIVPGPGDSALSSNPEVVDFGYVSALQFSEEVTVDIVNDGGTSVEIQAIRINDGDMGAFNLQMVPAQLPLILSPGGMETISVYFAPPSSDIYLGSVEVVTDVDTLNIPLGGCSTSSDCVVEFEDPPGDDDDAADDDDDDDTNGTPDINVDPGSINFGDVPANQAAIGDVIVVSNLGDGSLDIDSVSLTSSTGHEAYFSVVGFSGGTLPAGGAPINLNVTFDPYGAPEGPMSAEITIVSDDPDEGEIVVPLSVNVTEDCVGCPPILEVTGAVDVDLLLAQITYVQVSTGTGSVTISNVGTGALQVDPVTEGGQLCADYGPISYTGGAASSLSPGESTTLNFSVGQAGLEVINLGSGDSFTIGTFPPPADPLAVFDSEMFTWGIDNCGFSVPGFP